MNSADNDAVSLLYNTSFNLHKLTPLNLNGTFNSASTLKSHSTRLTNVLRGDVLRGVRVAESQPEDSASRTGSLQRIDFTPLQVRSSEGNLKAVSIIFRYEKITYTAYLLQDTHENNPELGATSSRRASLRRASVRVEQLNYYPLLLTRLPGWLQIRFLGYLAENFDCHVSNLRLPDDFIMRSIEQYLSLFAPTDDILENNRLSKNLQIWLEPPMVAKGDEEGQKQVKLQTLRTILMTFTRDDVPGMLYKGKQIQEKQEEGDGDDKRGPFELALSLYAYHHMGIFIEKMKVQKAACGEFVVGIAADGSGRCKLFAPTAEEMDESMVEGSGRRKRSWEGMLVSLVRLAC